MAYKFNKINFSRLKDGHRLIMDDRYELNVMYKQHKVIFNMKDVHVDDTANYTLMANNGMQSRNRTVQVLVRGEIFVIVLYISKSQFGVRPSVFEIKFDSYQNNSVRFLTAVKKQCMSYISRIFDGFPGNLQKISLILLMRKIELKKCP